jgi:hypothetical protein
MIVVGAARVAIAGPGRRRVFVTALLAAFAAESAGCGGDDVPVGGARGGAIAALVDPNDGNLPNPPPAVDAAVASEGGAVAGDATAGGPTWTYVFTTYFYMTCQTTCHPQMSAPRNGYVWLKSQGYIAGTSSAIAGPQSCLAWYGGDMPPGGATNTQGVADLNAWVAAGALQN